MLKEELINSIENPDGGLAMAAQAGDELAGETLIKKYVGIVRKSAAAYNKRDIPGMEFEDLLQEGMIGLFKAVQSYDASKKASFGTHAMNCVNNQIISAIRSANRKKHKPLNTSDSFSKPLTTRKGNSGSPDGLEVTLGDTLSTDPADSPDEMLIIKDVAYYILNNGDNIFSNLEMQVLNEYIKGFTSGQIAKRLGKSDKSVDNALQRAKKKVYDYLRK